MRSFSLRVLTLVVVAAAAAGGWWLKFEHSPPRGILNTGGERIGGHSRWDLVVEAPGWPGLRRVELSLSTAKGLKPVLVKDYPAQSWIGSGVQRDRIAVDLEAPSLGLEDGPAVARVVVETYAWKVLAPRRRVVAEQRLEFDLTAPRISLLSRQHNVRLGGSSVAVFRVGSDTARAGVSVADYFFPATLGYFTEPNVAVAVFAVPQDLDVGTRVQIVATDLAGNTRTVPLPCRVREHSFRTRTIEITDGFLTQKVPELQEANHLPRQPDLLQAYLYINRDLRAATERRLREITRTSHPKPLWHGAFRRQPNAAAMSFFADRRTYVYHGRIIDRQTHLGYDLASVQGATIEAAQDGIVVFAGNLGIYGETVVIDHGLGVFTLYGHLRAVGVGQGQRVRAGEAIGQSGMTGLAGGDHLHFSVMLYGIHVDPREWWDPKWMQDHVNAKLAMLPAAAESTRPATAEEEHERPAT